MKLAAEVRLAFGLPGLGPAQTRRFRDKHLMRESLARAESREQLVRLLPAFDRIPEVVLEEFVAGREFTFDTICADGRILFHNILRYTPVIRALGFRTGFTHMEWFLKDNGEVVFIEIAARPPGGLTGELNRRFGPHIVRHEILPIGAARRDWKQTLLSDGFVILRHPDLEAATRMSEYVASQVRLYAG